MRHRVAAIDTGTTVNGSTLVILEERASVWGILFAKEWRGAPGRPLDLRGRKARSSAERDEGEGQEMARIVRDHGLDSWAVDSYGLADIQIVSAEWGLTWKLQTGPLGHDEGKDGTLPELGIYDHGVYVVHHQLAVANGPLGPQLVAELQAITEKRSGGKVTPVLASQGRAHSDLASAWLRALWHAGAGNGGERSQNLSSSPHRYASMTMPLSARLAR